MSTYQVYYFKYDWIHARTPVYTECLEYIEADCIEEAELKFMTAHPFDYEGACIMNTLHPKAFVVTPFVDEGYENRQKFWVKWWKLINERSFELFMIAQEKKLARRKNRYC